MSPAVPLSFDPIERAAELWGGRIGDPTAMAAVTNVMRVQQILQREVDAALARHGITFARYEALVLLSFARTGRLAMSVMGRRLQLHPTSVTNIVDRLEGDKLVRRVPDAGDRRTTLVELTAAGHDVLAAATTTVIGIRFGLAGLTPAQARTLTDLLTKVRRAAGDFRQAPTHDHHHPEARRNVARC
ncbi:MarR family winged helix-turn-helix transcriptional regulator [Amycolatopsis sp. NPDC098790]|uniref:MarR family winged helix-turn-helix transcriptional regulator n=1 Tax=Amycolatopsis sp. NPDC098790 TaxID=3363939 RepID=UPI0038282C81